jgi:uncharacterized membrane protein
MVPGVGPVYNVYRGIAAVPSINATGTSIFWDGAVPPYPGAGSLVTAVYITNSAPIVIPTVVEITYVASPSSRPEADDRGEYRVVNIIRNGEVTTMETTIGFAVGANYLFGSFAVNANGWVTSGTPLATGGTITVEQDVTGATFTSLAGGVILLGGIPMSFNSDTQVFLVTGGSLSPVVNGIAGIAASDYAANQVSYYATNNIVSALFIRL